jgi:hypothetical protein
VPASESTLSVVMPTDAAAGKYRVELTGLDGNGTWSLVGATHPFPLLAYPIGNPSNYKKN